MASCFLDLYADNPRQQQGSLASSQTGCHRNGNRRIYHLAFYGTPLYFSRNSLSNPGDKLQKRNPSVKASVVIQCRRYYCSAIPPTGDLHSCLATDCLPPSSSMR